MAAVVERCSVSLADLLLTYLLLGALISVRPLQTTNVEMCLRVAFEKCL